ncbi:MAG: ethanolamine permease [Bacteroidota bacterium]
MTNANEGLKRSLGPLMLWGLGVGYVISGMYFGWNLGLPEGGTGGLAVATILVSIMYLCFTFSYTELACAIPKAGGAFDYARRALGPAFGFLGGMAQNIEFIFAPPAIAFAIGAYLGPFLPGVPEIYIAIAAYFIFTGLNIYGVEAAASFELLITVIAIIGLLIFAGISLPEFDGSAFSANAWPNGMSGIFAAFPFAVWFYLAIEGVANVAEETIDPQRNVLIGFGSAIVTLVLLCALTFLASVGPNGWETAVFPTGSTEASDAPLPLVTSYVLGADHSLVAVVGIIGLFGLIASFHGIILAAGRASYEFGKAGFAPRILGKVLDRRRTPANALIFNMLIGIVALLTGKTGDIITIACMGALSMYLISLISLFVLRSREPEMERPFKVPLFPVLPGIAFAIAAVALVAIVYFNPMLAAIYGGIMLVSWGLYRLLIHRNLPQD